VALYDLDGTTVGAAIIDGSLGVFANFSETVGGDSAVMDAAVPVDLVLSETLVGAANLSANTQAVFNMSGYVLGGSALLDLRLIDISGILAGAGVLTGNLLRILAIDGYTSGGSSLALSVPEPIYGVGILTGFMEVIHVPLPLCEIPPVSLSFPWGHQFTRDDLSMCFEGGRPVCVHFTLYQMVPGCQPIQKGPSNRKPVLDDKNCYYATGTAGECGQPGLWAIKWSYQRTFGAPMVEKTCYFTVLDAVLSPVPGDTLQRVCKYGWDS
jgi:hypothetical protein